MNWNKFEDPRPYVGVIGFAFDASGRFPIMYRSNKVRSAKNAWSLISGLHEVGKNVYNQFIAEAFEECGITRDKNAYWEVTEKIGFYEAIIPSEGWHWVMTIVAMGPFDHTTLVNKEPDKHTEIRLITVDELYTDFNVAIWTPNTMGAFLANESRIRAFAKRITQHSDPTILDANLSPEQATDE